MIKQAVLATALIAAAAAAPARAVGYIYVGSWEVDQGPKWTGAALNGPLAYTGQEAAALLFGGSAVDYAISTVGSQPADIDFDAWYSVIGYVGNRGHGGSILADDYSSKYLGRYYGPTANYAFNDPDAAASAYVDDNARRSGFVNYAFRIDNDAVPEPATWAMMLVGMARVGWAMRRGMRGRGSDRSAISPNRPPTGRCAGH